LVKQLKIIDTTFRKAGVVKLKNPRMISTGKNML